MLMTIGPLTFEIAPVSLMGYQRTYKGDFAEKPVLMARPTLEFVGPGAEAWRLKARIAPKKFGGEGALDKLRQATISGKPLYAARGDGKAIGWVVIEDVGEEHQYLSTDGQGQLIEVDISIKLSDKPSDGSFFSIISSIAQAATGFLTATVSAQ